MTVLIDLIAGARPNFMKIAPLIEALRAAESRGSRLRYRLVHTGQHYDRAMSGSFFEELGIPEPEVNLAAGSGTQAEQTAAIMLAYERLLLERAPKLCLVVGDVTSTMACAIVARKLQVPVAHVEAGIRSGDWTMPEEINRVVTDSITNWFFTTSRTANDNLLRAGAREDQVFFVGNTMIDTLLRHRSRLRQPACWQSLGLTAQGYFVVTLHRPANVDRPEQLGAMLRAIGESSSGLPMVFPAHPRTQKSMKSLPGLPSNIHVIDPLGYLEFNYMVERAKAVITDSGGITEESTVLGVPCLTLRDSTERPETVTVGTNELLGTNPASVGPAVRRVMAGEWKRGAIPELWDGHTGERIVAELERVLPF